MTPTSFNEANFSGWIDLLQKGVTAVATAGDNKYVGNKYSYSSAAKAASNLIAVFPTICSSSISADTAYIISKAVERKAFVILQLALTAANITDMRDGIEYLRQFHQNLKTNSSAEDYMMALDKFADANGGSYAADRQEMRKFLRMEESTGILPLDNIKETSINDFMIREMGFGGIEIMGRIVSEAKHEKRYNAGSTSNDMYDDHSTNQYSTTNHNYNSKYDYSNDDYKEMLKNEKDKSKYQADREKDERDNAKEREKRRKEFDTSRQSTAEYERDRAKIRKDREQYEFDRAREEDRMKDLRRQQDDARKSSVVNYIKPPSALRDQDVKKMNELVPMIMTVSFKNTQTGGDVNFIIGIKSKCIKANSDEIIKKIYNNNQDGKGLVNFIRATTGEIKFVKDLLLGLDQNKQDVIAASKRGSNEEIWNTLKIRAQNAKMYLRQGAVNYASAITTVVISQEDADYMYKTMNIDINNPHTALQFMKAYNLLGFCIVDDTVEEAKFLWDDGDPRFESVSYTMLEREEKDQSYKKVVNLLAKMR